MQKILKAAVAATLVTPPIVMPGVANAADTVFSDVPKTQTHYDNIMALYNEKVISGYPDGTYKPNASVTRGQAAKIIAGVLGLIKPENTYTGPNPNFADVPVTHSYYKYIAVLAQAGIINGYPDGTYKPNNTLRRGQMAKIIYNGFNLDKFPDVALPFTDIKEGNQYYDQIKSLYALGVTVGKTATTYSEGEAVTRGQLASFVMRARHVEDRAMEVKVQNIINDRVVTNKGTYTIGNSLRGILSMDNVRALTGADLEVYVTNNVIVGVQSIELNARGNESSPIVFDGGEEVFHGNLAIKSEYTEVNNITIDGDVVINGVNSGANRTAKFVKFSNTSVAGTTTVKDQFDGTNNTTSPATAEDEIEVTVSNSELGVVSIARDFTTFVTDTPMRYVSVADDVSAFSLYGDIEMLEARGGDVEVKGTGTITTFNYRGKGIAKLSLRGRVGNFNVTSEDARIFVGEHAQVDILAKNYKRELVDILMNMDEAETRIYYVTDYGKENNGMESLEDLLVYTTRTNKLFYQGEALDLTEFVVQGVYADGSLKRQHIKSSNITGYNPNLIGDQTIKITVDGISKEMKVTVLELKSIKIVTNPTKTMYRIGDSFSTSGIVVEGTYADGTVRRETITDADASGFNLTRPGSQAITIRKQNRTAAYVIQVVAQHQPLVSALKITRPPTTTTYYQGESLLLNGMVVTGIYEDGSERVERVNMANITGYDPMRAGKQSVTVSLNGHMATFDVDVIEMTDLILRRPPIQKEYQVYEGLNTAGMELIARYADGREMDVKLNEAKITGFSSARPGSRSVRITYNGRAISFNVTIMNIDRIAVSKLPDKLAYFPGEELDLTGMELQAQYSDQSTRIFPGDLATVSGFNPNLVGEQVLTVTYDNKSSQFKVKVLPLLSIHVEQPPVKVVYREGEELDLTGLKVIGTYEGNRTREEQITKSMISGFDSSAHGTQQKVTITLNNLETTFDVTISKSPLALKELIIDKLPERIRYRTGIPFSIEGLELTGLYNDNTSKPVPLDDPNIKLSTIDTSKPGRQTFKIEYGDVIAEFEVEVYDVALDGLTVSTTKSTYSKGESFIPGTLTVKANFADGDETLKEGDYEVTGFDPMKVGEQTLTISYRDKTTTLKVRVNENNVRNFTVEPEMVFVTRGGQVDVTKLKLNVTLDNALNEQITVMGTLEEVEITSFDNSKLGAYTVNVSYRGKYAPLKVYVVDEQTIVSIDKVELWWDKNGTHTKYPYSVVSKDDVDANNVYFKVLQATNGAGKIITDEATLNNIKISTVNFANRITGQADTTSAQVNAATGRLTIASAADLDVHFTYSVDGVPLDNPYTYALNMVSQRQATSSELTSGSAIATANSSNITPLARTISFDVLDQVGERFDLPMSAPFYTLTKEGATEAATASAVSSYASGAGTILTNLNDAGTYTLRLYTAANKSKVLGEFPLAVKQITVPAEADAYEYKVSFNTSKEVLDVANYEWANGYGAAPTKTDALTIRAQAFVEDVEVAMPAGATVKLKNGTAMKLSGNTVTAGNDVKPMVDSVVVMVGTREMAASPSIRLLNTLPKYDAFTATERVDIFKYFTSANAALMNKLRNGETLSDADKVIMTSLVGKALRDVWSVKNEDAMQAIKEITVVPTPTSSSADGSQKTTAVNVLVHKQFTENGTEKFVTVNGEYIEAWMNKAASTLQKTDRTPAQFTVMLDDMRVDEVPASTIMIRKAVQKTITTTPKMTIDGSTVVGQPTTTQPPVELTPILAKRTFDSSGSSDTTYKNRTELEQLLNELSNIFTIEITSNAIRFTLKEGLSLTKEETAESDSATVKTREDISYRIITNMRTYTLSLTATSIDIPLAEFFTAYKKPSTLVLDGQVYKFSTKAGPADVEKLEEVPAFSSMTALAAMINEKFAGTYRAEALNDQLKIFTAVTGEIANDNLNGALKVNDLPVATTPTPDPATQFKTPWTLGQNESFVGNLTLTFSQAVELPLENFLPVEDFIVNYTVEGTPQQLKIAAADVSERVVVNGTTVTVKLDHLPNAAHFSNPNMKIIMDDISGLKAVKGYYEKDVKRIYEEATVTVTPTP